MPIDLSSIPSVFADFLGIDVFAANFLVLAGLLVVVLLPILVMGKGHSKLTFIIGFITLCFGVAVAWVPVWVFGVILLAIAFDTANRLKRLIG